jgi:hypothetical protein
VLAVDGGLMHFLRREALGRIRAWRPDDSIGGLTSSRELHVSDDVFDDVEAIAAGGDEAGDLLADFVNAADAEAIAGARPHSSCQRRPPGFPRSFG